MYEESELIEDWSVADPPVLTAQSFKEPIFLQRGYANPGTPLAISARWKELQQVYVTLYRDDLGASDFAVESVIEHSGTAYLLLGLAPPEAGDCEDPPFFLVKLLNNDTVEVITGEQVNGILTFPLKERFKAVELVERYLGSLLTWEELSM